MVGSKNRQRVQAFKVLTPLTEREPGLSGFRSSLSGFRTGIHECRIGMPKQWSYRDSGKESTRIPIQSHENPDNIPISAPDFGSLKGSYRDSETTVPKKVSEQSDYGKKKFLSRWRSIYTAVLSTVRLPATSSKGGCSSLLGARSTSWSPDQGSLKSCSLRPDEVTEDS